MIRWYTGQSGAGKTTAARRWQQEHPGTVLLDGDAMRAVWPGLGFTYTDRLEQNIRIARLALELDRQGFAVVVATIAPYRSMRRAIARWLAEEGAALEWVFVPGGRATDEDHPYEPPTELDRLTNTVRELEEAR